jgi:phenylacetic acid degradation operon negative regulatory protein
MAAKSVDPFTSATRTLAARFRRQRPLRGGSLLVTILGDAIAPRGGCIALASLIQLARPFGLTERLVRTSISRLANEEWVSSQRVGRSSYYSLTAPGRIRFAEATQRIYGAAPDSWDGQWTLVVVPPALKRLRDDLREELRWLGFGQLTSSRGGGVFAHPTHREDEIRARLAELERDGQLIVIRGNSTVRASDTHLVAMGWDFGDLTRRYRRFIGMFAPARDALNGPLNDTGGNDAGGETSFVLRTLLLHEYRKIHLRDPLLPASLLPPAWAGTDAYDLCRRLYAAVFPASERYLSQTVQTLAGALPAPASDIFARFGGLPKGETT